MKTCPDCEGTGNTLKVIDDSDILRNEYKCKRCKGTGEIE